ncbi:hypothetical protein H6F93_25090 [Leptolyngbya sp. FACHB-671]|uniref:TMEM14 family protein n=1 Tax=unclassified Leptolyngbya TaxID=2650499 RepID=UPI0016827C45|nr:MULTISPECIES: TMEM14 family protein [unclassified Leptolyngbya]MBD2001238.1 hypothetical protein [Leptolyngbya sp. FACHB-541]MBD2070751.1 hypothetical protein [Leptolyngbya sp. FACHB-671]
MNLAIVAAIAYGILSIVGGIIGYVQAQSKTSLISGSVSGALLILAGILSLTGISGGLWLAAIVTVALIIVFAVRLSKTRKFMPAGLMIIAGAVAFIPILQNL